MAATKTQEASSSSVPCSYHVFLSFRGGDTRKNFTDHLYTALVQQGIHTFRDDDEIQRGENIELEIQRAIRESKLSIIILSQDYASSRWCLDELVMIMERRRLVGHVVVPVFYDVDPSQVKNQTGRYGEAFARHEKDLKEEMNKVEQWRDALREAADMRGMVLQNGYESQFIQNIVREVENKLSRTVLNVSPYLVGMNSRIAQINHWLQDGSDDVEIATIYGIGGIGKTTIAKIVYNLNFNRFDGSSFLANVREISEQPNGLIRLQRQLLSDLVKGKTSKIYNIDEGITRIRDVLYGKRVLLILDDVDDVDQFNAIVGMREWFHPGSKIIITTRHEHLLRFIFRFEVEQLDDKESVQLLSWHAFGQDHPADGYQKHSENVARHCGGLPLALQVLGSSLSGKTTTVWENALQKLEKIADSKIQHILRISFDSLQDDHDKSLFLDIACFFTGMVIEYAIRILDGCDFFAIVGIQNLINKCLVTVDEEHRLMVHQLVRDMGREIVRQESPDDPGKRSRLWDPKDATVVLRENAGTESIRGLSLNLPVPAEDKRTRKNPLLNLAKKYDDQDSIEKSRLLDEENFLKRHKLSNLSWQPAKTAPISSFSARAFEKMVRLKLLNLNYVKLNGDYKEFPTSLVWLCWRGFPLNSMPIDLCLDKLVALDMRNSKVKYLWKGIKFLVELRILNLSHSHGLVRTPNFRGLPSLEKLVFKDCTSLVDIDESIGGLERLVILNLRDCKSLKKLPEEITMLESLEELVISGCSNLFELPKELAKLQSLKVFHADRIAINQVDSSTGVLKELSLSLWHSTSWSWLLQKRWATSTRFSLAFLPRFLVSLSLANCCLSDNAIPEDLSCLLSLEYLNLSGNQIRCLPESINGLVSLGSLVLEQCASLQSLPELPMSLNSLKLEDCTSLERLTNLPNLLKSLDLEIFGCEKLVEVQGIFKLEPLGTNTEILNNLGLFNLESLEGIEVEMSNSLSCTEMKTSIQVLHECGIFSIFLPGGTVPDWFELISESPAISFNVEPVPAHKVKGLSLCILYMNLADGGQIDGNCAKINNKTKGVKWTYSPNFYGIPEVSQDMLWLSYWTFGDQLKAGDEVQILAEMASGLHVKACGVRLVYEQEYKDVPEIVQSSSTKYPTMADTDMSDYELGTASYFLCHHNFQTHQGAGRYDWDDLSGYEYIFEDREKLAEPVMVPWPEGGRKPKGLCTGPSRAQPSPPSPLPLRTTSSSIPTTLLNRYELGKLLGRGSFAKVYAARSLTDDKLVAIKVIDKTRMVDAAMEPRILCEISAMCRLKHHPNILKIHEVMATRTKIYLVIELALGGELFSKVLHRVKLKESKARRYFQQLVSALHFCHQNGVTHRDLKPQNLLLDENGNIKVSDFGLSALAEAQKGDVLQTACGTPAFTAPEVMAQRGYDGAKADAWSCGVILFFLLSAQLPFDDTNLVAMYKKIRRREYQMPSPISKSAKSIITRLLDPNPNTRMSIQELMNHSWFLKSYELPTQNSMFETEHTKFCKYDPSSVSAFDIISLSSGLDLSGLFDVTSRRTKSFTSRETMERMAERVREVGRQLGYRVEEGKGGAIGLGKGRVVVVVEAVEVAEKLLVVELKVVQGGGVEFGEAQWGELKDGLQDVVLQ